MSPFCIDHPQGTQDACRPCGTARLNYSRARNQAERDLLDLDDGAVLTLNQVWAANDIIKNLEDLARALGVYVHCHRSDPEVSAIARKGVDLYVRRAAPSFSRLLAGDFLDSLREVHDRQRETLEPTGGVPIGTQSRGVVCVTCGAPGESAAPSGGAS